MNFKKEYIIQQKLCETSSSLIYKGIHNVTKETMTIKFEKPNGSVKFLANETKIRQYLDNVNGIPKLMEYGIFRARRYIIYPYISHTLYNTTLTQSEIFNCAEQLLVILKNIHQNGILHCDISAMNVFCDSTKTKFYLSDFGQAKHVTFSINSNLSSNKMSGCPLFCSINIHKGDEYSYRDDLISLGYLIYYSIKKTITWSGLSTCREIFEKKLLFSQKYSSFDIPEPLKIYFNYCFHLEINQKPKYLLLSQLFKDHLQQLKQITIPT